VCWLEGMYIGDESDIASSKVLVWHTHPLSGNQLSGETFVCVLGLVLRKGRALDLIARRAD